MGSIRESIRETINNSNEGAKKQISLMIDEQLLHLTDKVGEKMKTLTNNKVGSRNQLIELALTEYVKEATTVLREDFLLDINEVVPSVDKTKDDQATEINNVLIVPAYSEQFESEFMENHQWVSIRIAQHRVPEIEYVAAYRNAPYSCITHYAKVKDIQLNEDDGKYTLLFDGPPCELPNTISRGVGRAIRRGMYTSLDKLLTAGSIFDLE